MGTGFGRLNTEELKLEKYDEEEFFSDPSSTPSQLEFDNEMYFENTGGESQLDVIDQDDLKDYIIWSYQDDKDYFLRDTCDCYPYEIEVDQNGILTFISKNMSSISMANQQGSTVYLPKIIKRYDVKDLLEQSPLIIPGIEELIFTVSVSNNVVAIHPNGESGLAHASEKNQRGIRDDTVLLHK